MNITEAYELYQRCISLELEGAEKLKKYTLQELATICNGIGAEWMPEWMRKTADWIFPHIKPTAFLHDVDFFEGGT